MSTFRPKNLNTSIARPLPKSVKTLLNKPKPPLWAKSLVARKAEQFARWRVEGTPFLVGQKKVYLPKFHITFLRTPNLSPHWAQFQVPLYFNKLDMRDYLYHAYNVPTRTIRSFIPPRPKDRRMKLSRPAQRRFYQPRSVKKMTVQLEEPFVWPKGPDPENPEEWQPWDRARFRETSGKAVTPEEEAAREKEKTLKRHRVKSHESIETPELRRRSITRTQSEARQKRSDLRKEAEDLLKGRKKWGNVVPDAEPQSSESENLPMR